MGTLRFCLVKNTHPIVMKYALAVAIVLVAVNASPMVQNQQLAATKAQITEQLANFYESEGVANAKNKAREVSQKSSPSTTIPRSLLLRRPIRSRRRSRLRWVM